MVRNFRRLSWSLSLMRLLHTIDSINKGEKFSNRVRSENIIYKLVHNDGKYCFFFISDQVNDF